MGALSPVWPTRLLRGVLGLNALAQGLVGGAGFALAPQALFPGVSLDAAAMLGFRLAGFTNASVAGFVLWALVRAPGPSLRALAVFMGGYHALAGLEGWRVAALGGPLGEVASGTLPFHLVTCTLLWLAAAGDQVAAIDPHLGEPPAQRSAST